MALVCGGKLFHARATTTGNALPVFMHHCQLGSYVTLCCFVFNIQGFLTH